ncbi:MAG: UMP kinase [bacterium]|nr:UMP kinase [bacterium]
MKKGNLYVLSLGGSMIAPPDGIDTTFLKKFTDVIRRRVKEGDRFVIISGGGITCRNYQKAASKVRLLNDEDLDWLGIHATRLNAHLMRTILRDVAHPTVLKDPTRPVLNWKKPVLVCGGWKPGRSTDDGATRFAKQLGATTVVNISNVDYLYDKDPAKYKSAKKVDTMTWKDYRKMVGNVWSPGMNLPFDPVASRLAQSSGITVVLVGGKDVKNIENIFADKPFRGSTIAK